ncbi:hypothetical protein LINPERPRIM_LOCUS40483, partial [Linum perenne]
AAATHRNDSPIVGLAMGLLETPSSTAAKKTISKLKNINNNIKTPGSGEALLRGQVKTLLQRVEEEAELSKISLESRPFLRLQGFLNSSPMGLLAPSGEARGSLPLARAQWSTRILASPLLAPTPANTPVILDDLTNDNINSAASMMISPLPVTEEQIKICEAVVSEMYSGRKLEILESQKSVNRQLLLDFSLEKSESCDSTTESGSKEEEKSITSSPISEVTDDDSASMWSIQVNASTHDDDDDYAVIAEDGEECYDVDNYYNEEEGEEEEGSTGEVRIDELCEGISRMFNGKHKRFEYNSDDELLVVGDSDML